MHHNSNKKRNGSVAAVASLVTALLALLLVGCGGSSNASADKPSAVSSTTQQEAQKPQPVSKPEPEFKPKAEPDEDKDVSGLRLESGIVDGVTNTHLKFDVTNHTSEVCDYTIVVDLDSDMVSGREISVEDVAPGETVPYDEEVDAADGNVTPLKIDRFSQDEGPWSDDQGTSVLKLRKDGDSVVLDWSVINYATETSAYEVTYLVRDETNVSMSGTGPVIHKGTLKTQALEPGTVNGEYGPDEPGTHNAGGSDSGLLTIPSSKLPGGLTVADNGEISGLMVEIADQDRIIYEESGA